MNKQNGPNGIEWTTWTWNPVTGCERGCPYCYARRAYERFGKSFLPQFWPERLTEIKKAKAGDKVFVGSVTDMMEVPNAWVLETLESVKSRPDVTFQWLTKSPQNYQKFNPWPENVWLGATCESQEQAASRIPDLYRADCRVKFISIEPLLGPIDFSVIELPVPGFQAMGVTGVLPEPAASDDYIYGMKSISIGWVIIGAQSGPNAVKPKPEWIADIVKQCDSAQVPVFMKSSLKPYVDELRQEWPRGTTLVTNDRGMNV